MKIGLAKVPWTSFTKTRSRSGSIRTLKYWLMRIQIAIFLATTISVQAMPGNVVGQNRVTLHEKNATLLQVLRAIKAQTGMGFGGQDLSANSGNPVTVSVDNAEISNVLELIFQTQPYSYEIVGQIIVVKKREVADIPPSAGVGPGDAKTVNIEGAVYNESADPLAGANVLIKELHKGTVTNARGEFKLPGVPVNSTLYVSYVGYAPEKITVTTGTSIKVYLKVARDQLDRAVVQAYGQTTQRLATGNIGTVRAEDIEKQPVMNVLDAVQGLVPGAVVTNTSGYASGQIKVEVRGRNTINPAFPSDPLYIVDGVPLTVLPVFNEADYGSGAAGFIQSGMDSYAGGQSPLFSLDPSNIESINILKDADATAIYGSRGANGVILITTKKGKAGKATFDLNMDQGQTFITRIYPMANTHQYLAMRTEALNNDGIPVNINNAPDLFTGDTTRNTNWQKYIGGKMGTRTDVNASFTGGTATTTYRLSGSYAFGRDMTAVSGGNSRGSFALNLNHKSIDQRLSIGLTANYSYVDINEISMPGSPNMAPDAPPVFDKYGDINYTGWDQFFGAPGSSPFYLLLQPYAANTNFLNSSLLVGFEVLKGLTFRASLGYNNAITNQQELIPIASSDPANGITTAANSIGNTQIHNIIVEPQLEYKKYVGAGKFNVLIGATSQKNTTTASRIVGSGIPNDALIQEISAATVKNVYYGGGQYRYAGIFGRLNYNLNDKYILNLNLRRDGSSRFGPGKQYGNFGSLGAAWIFTEENWIKRNVRFLSFGKIRASYGLTGGDQIAQNEYLTQWIFGQNPYNGLLPLTPIKHTDSLFHWQTTKKLEIGLDVAVIKDRITLSVARYVNRCDDQLVDFPLAYFTGFPTVLTNSPADVQNDGWEFSINSKILDGKQLKLSAAFNIGINHNKLVSYPNFSESPYSGRLRIGQSLNITRVLHCIGVDPQTGFYAFEDKNKDGQITYDQTGRTPDDTYTIDLAPKYDGSFSLIVDYKKLDVSTSFYFRKQMGNTATASLDVPGDATNQPVEVINNHWQRPGQVAEFAKFTTSATDPSWNYHGMSDGVLTDASFLRMQNLSIAYSLLGNRWQIKGIREIRLSVKAQNLFVITRYKGSDPEVQSFSSLPLPRTITAGINMNF